MAPLLLQFHTFIHKKSRFSQSLEFNRFVRPKKVRHSKDEPLVRESVGSSARPGVHRPVGGDRRRGAADPRSGGPAGPDPVDAVGRAGGDPRRGGDHRLHGLPGRRGDARPRSPGGRPAVLTPARRIGVRMS